MKGSSSHLSCPCFSEFMCCERVASFRCSGVPGFLISSSTSFASCSSILILILFLDPYRHGLCFCLFSLLVLIFHAVHPHFRVLLQSEKSEVPESATFLPAKLESLWGVVTNED